MTRLALFAAAKAASEAGGASALLRTGARHRVRHESSRGDDRSCGMHKYAAVGSSLAIVVQALLQDVPLSYRDPVFRVPLSRRASVIAL